MGREPGALFDWADAEVPAGVRVDGLGVVDASSRIECGCGSRGPAISSEDPPSAWGGSLPAMVSGAPLGSGSAAGLDLPGRVRQRAAQLVAHRLGGEVDWGDDGPVAPNRDGSRERGGSSARLVGYDETTGGSSGESWAPGDPGIPQADTDPEGGCACESDNYVTVHARDLAELRDQCTLDLGYSTADAADLSYTLACGSYQCSKKDLWQHYLVDWVAKRSLKLSTAGLSVFVDPKGDHPGLFWNGEGGFMRGALQFALVTLHTYLDELVDGCDVFTDPCRLHVKRFRASLENGGVSTTTDGLPTVWGIDVIDDQLGGTEGQIEVLYGQAYPSYDDEDIARSWSGVGALTPRIYMPTFFGTGSWAAVTFMTQQTYVMAAMADYFFWWAARLHWEFLETGDPWAERVAYMAVRAAMAEISALAGLIIHEYTHVSGSAWEDFEAPADCQNACHHMLGYIVHQRLLARLGCPVPLTQSDTSLTFMAWRVSNQASRSLDVGDRFDFLLTSGDYYLEWLSA